MNQLYHERSLDSTPNSVVPSTMNTMTTKNPIHRGMVTYHQDQRMTPVSLSAKKLYAIQEALSDKQHKSVHVGKVFEAFQAAQDEFLKAVL
jgi:hypothetical protein